ncbi:MULTISPECIES: RNA polymerase sigma factor [Streptomyces]|uniref:RNA polymerase sigma factor n=1 Tax=Streptomyces TaxID=1883 RepID=UPI0036BBEC16
MSSENRLLIDGKLQDPASIELRDFAAFYKEMAPRITWAIRNTLGHQYVEGGDVDDIAQQVWETILKNWERIGRITAPHKYTHILAVNVAKRAAMRRNAVVTVAEVTTAIDPRSTDPGPEPQIEARSLWRSLKKALAPRQVQVLALAFDGHSDKDIATILNITTDSVRSHRRHARKQLTLDPTPLHPRD